MGSCSRDSPSSLRRQRYVSWCVDPAETGSSGEIPLQNHLMAFSGSVPRLLLTPADTREASPHQHTHLTVTKRTHKEVFTLSRHSLVDADLLDIDRSSYSHSDDEGMKGHEDDSSPRHPEDQSFLLLLRRSSPVISRRQRPVSWQGGGTDSFNPSRPDSLDQRQPASVTTLDDLDLHSSSRCVSVSSNLSDEPRLRFSGQQGLAEEHRGRGLLRCQPPHSSAHVSRQRRSRGVPEFSADLLKTHTELEKENAHFIVVDMVLEVLEGAKWTLMMDTHQNTQQHTLCPACTQQHTLCQACTQQHTLCPTCTQQHTHCPACTQQHTLCPACTQQHTLCQACTQQHTLCPTCTQQHTLCPTCTQQHTHCPACTQQHTLCPACTQQHTLCPTCTQQHTLCQACTQQHTLCQACTQQHTLCQACTQQHTLCPTCTQQHTHCQTCTQQHTHCQTCTQQHTHCQTCTQQHTLCPTCTQQHTHCQTCTQQHTHCQTCTQQHTSSSEDETPLEQTQSSHHRNTVREILAHTHSDKNMQTSHRNTHSSYAHTHKHTQEEEEGVAYEEAKHQPKTFSVLSNDSGFEDCGADSLTTQRDSLRNAEALAQQLVLEFRRSWLPSDGPRRGRQSLRSSLLELPGGACVTVVSSGLAEEIRLRTRMRGCLSWAPPRVQIIYTVQPNHRRSDVVAQQNFLCAGCGTELEHKYIKKLRYCEYLGRYFCDCCHSGSEAVIPARVLTHWDFSRFPVSDFSKQLLDSVWFQPLFDLSCVGKKLYGRVKELRRFRELQDQLLCIKKLLKACRLSKRVMTEFEQLPAHLTEQPHLFSMDDLLRVKKGQLVSQAQAVLNSAIGHVENCQLCLARGFICEFCREKDVIFPFQTDMCRRCPVCRACFHKRCFVEKKCPKCARIQSRKKRPDR